VLLSAEDRRENVCAKWAPSVGKAVPENHAPRRLPDRRSAPVHSPPRPSGFLRRGSFFRHHSREVDGLAWLVFRDLSQSRHFSPKEASHLLCVCPNPGTSRGSLAHPDDTSSPCWITRVIAHERKDAFHRTSNRDADDNLHTGSPSAK